MGLVMAMSAVVGADLRSVEEAFADMARDHDGTFEPTDSAVGDDATAVMAAYPAGVTVVYPDGFVEWDDASSALSVALQTSVFSLHIHDGDLWMFLLFTRGERVAQFNTIPDYWGEGVDAAAWTPDPSIVAAAVPGADPGELAPYLKPWEEDVGYGTKLRPGDQSGHGQDWQVLDFMGRLGFGYPEPGTGVTYRFLLTLE